MKNIYLDHQASTLVDPRVIRSMNECMLKIEGNPHSSSHLLGQKSKYILSEATSKIARLINADEREIIFVSGATMANNIVLQGLENVKSSGRNVIIISKIEHPCVEQAARFMKKNKDFKLIEIDVDKNGFLDLKQLSKSLSDKVALVSVIMANNEIGTLQNIKVLANLTHDYGALFHTDAAQAIGKTNIDTLSLDVDLMSISGHKIGGPQGVGILFARQGVELQPLIHGGGQQRFVSGTVPLSLAVGMGEVASILMDEGIGIREHLKSLKKHFWNNISKYSEKIKVNGPIDFSKAVSSNLNLCFINVPALELLHRISPQVSASIGSACASGKGEGSKVLKALGLSDNEVSSSIRFSFGMTNTLEEVEYAAKLIGETYNKLSK